MQAALDKELINYIFKLDEAGKKVILEIVKRIVHESSSKLNVDRYNKDIEEAIARVEAGDFLTQHQVEKISKEW